MTKITSNNLRLVKFINWKPKYNKLSTIIKSCINWERKLVKQQPLKSLQR